jgi:hypothetical protein
MSGTASAAVAALAAAAVVVVSKPSFLRGRR